jgi:general secretion pathway protein E
MHTLYEDGLLKVAAGVTSLEELLRVTEDHTDA